MFLVPARKKPVAAISLFHINPRYTNSEGNLITKTKTFSEERAGIPSCLLTKSGRSIMGLVLCPVKGHENQLVPLVFCFGIWITNLHQRRSIPLKGRNIICPSTNS